MNEYPCVCKGECTDDFTGGPCIGLTDVEGGYCAPCIRDRRNLARRNRYLKQARLQRMTNETR